MSNLEMIHIIDWMLLGFLFIVFSVIEGAIVGAAMLYSFVARTEIERRMSLVGIRAFWDSISAWTFLLGIVTLFFVWRSFFSPLFFEFQLLIVTILLLFSISRPVNLARRGFLASYLPKWYLHRCWDIVFSINAWALAILFGILVAQMLMGASYLVGGQGLRSLHEWMGLFSPFTYWCIGISIAALLMQGGLYLAVKTIHPVRARALFVVRMSAFLMICLFASAGLWVKFDLIGYIFSNEMNPLQREIFPVLGGWMHNYELYPVLFLVPGLGLMGALFALITSNIGTSRFALYCSSLSLASVLATVGVSMFPFILPSSLDHNASLLVWDGSTSRALTITLLSIVAMGMISVLSQKVASN
ncbi:MAG TPA: cytochrome d ubiquinol oxidase subunit II [Gammaproteobacteria bacterium]|jgi:cytochrome d ubiquinol oxidase subunit II|nr:cytochrome d ubiquinol oxidase subunit II [Gammaproteobacteria bacterium]